MKARFPSLVPALVLLVCCATGCSATDTNPCDEPGPADQCHPLDPGQPGPFPVGLTTVVLVDPSRTDRFGNPRALKTDIWYPATAESASLPDDRSNLRDEVPRDLLQRVADLELPQVAQAAKRDAPLEGRFAPYPLLTFSHGAGGIRFQTFTLMIHLASHGYVVAAPDHVDNTIWDALRDLNVDLTTMVASLVERPADIRFVAEQLAAGKTPLGPDLVDLERWGTFGHSMGAVATVALVARGSALEEPRIKAALPISPGTSMLQMVSAGPDRSGVPLMIMGGYLDRVLTYIREQQQGYQMAPAPKALVGLPQAGHYSFTELCPYDFNSMALHVGLDVSSILNDGCQPEALDLDTVHRIQNYFAAAFFNATLRGATRRYLAPYSVPSELAPHLVYEQQGLVP